MEHEVFVPVQAERLREALADPVRVARAVPGLQQDAGTPPVSGRLKVRVGGHTITYRGTVRVTARDDGSYAVEGDATEARGPGTVKLALALTLSPSDGGTTVTITGTTTADGRVADLPADAVSATTGRLLNRFVQNLAEVPETPPGAAEREPERETEQGRETEPEVEREPETEPEAEAEPAPEAEPSALFEEEEPAPPAPSRVNREDAVAEAAHARRTMIGRSAEEVDHAPPRGRYAPVPAPETVDARATLRWAAPAAAVALASAIAVTRALRKRR
ncbi:SRPBCC family protein [Streptomyces mirabilis]|jgi:carbon monoxide dehydrogenase subunit G|uniref:Carbon monoxide dehydrogenase subunit G n=1 Tax=Streptomyces mirabilis TaxID=68239 RepID=A0A1I2VRJ1_9ACTN|nr:SRPBCC domain-containing protein [Streptomyces mirabilis]SFG91770.1 Carbon monoxide dehydrogenase subunit G [Streptomyces mirabilis]